MKSTEKGETQEGDVLVTITKGLSYVPGLDVGVSKNHRRSKIPFDGLGRIWSKNWSSTTLVLIAWTMQCARNWSTHSWNCTLALILDDSGEVYQCGSFQVILYNIIHMVHSVQYYTYGSYYTILYIWFLGFCFFSTCPELQGPPVWWIPVPAKKEPSHHKSPVFNRLQHNFPEVERKKW